MFGRCHDIAANVQRGLDWHGVAGQTNLSRLWLPDHVSSSHRGLRQSNSNTNRDGTGKISLEVCNRLSVYPSRSLVGLHTFEGFPDFPLRDVERLCLVHGLLPSPVGPRSRLNNAAPS